MITATKLMETRDQLNLVDVSVMVYASRLSFWVVKKTLCGLSNSFPLEAENKKVLEKRYKQNFVTFLEAAQNCFPNTVGKLSSAKSSSAVA